MSGDNESADLELLKRYRRVSDAGPSQPKDAVREAILAEGRRAAARNTGAVPHRFEAGAAAANRPRWRYAAIGTACAAVLAAFLVVPQFLMQPSHRTVLPAAAPEQDSPVSAAREAEPAAPPPNLKTAPPAPPAPSRLSAPNLAAAQSARASSSPLAEEKKAAPPDSEFHGLVGGMVESPARHSQLQARASKPAHESSSDLRQVTITARRAEATAASAPIAAGAADAASPVTRNALTSSDRGASTAGAGAEPSGDLEEVAVTGARAKSPSTPLISAVNWGRAAKAAALLESGEGSVTETDSKGRTPLLRAVEHRRLDLVQLLLAHGADPAAPDAAGQTPLSVARQMQLADIVAALEAAARQAPP